MARPRFRQRSLDDRITMTLTAMVGMGHDILEKPVLVSTAQEVRCGNQQAGGRDLFISLGNEERQVIALQRLRQDALGPLERFRGGDSLLMHETGSTNRADQVFAPGAQSAYWAPD